MQKLLIANRGEIACRIARAAHSLGLKTVAVYSEADAGSLHVEMADEAVAVGPAAARESYLVADKILAAAADTGADAVHPGYGFLSENAGFARAVEGAGLTWVGPDPQSIVDMGDKERARDIAQQAGVPVVPGSPRFANGALDGIEAAGDAVGYPLLVKASAGGGGIGMRQVNAPEDLLKTAEATQSMAQNAFGDGTVFLERYIPKARHVEVQVFGDGAGHAVHLFERDCSTQRRFQKVIEESPAPNLPTDVRTAMADAAVALSRQIKYRGAGTVEFIVDCDTDDFYFLEMNTRIQVEHPATEMVTSRDLVAMQIELAQGTHTLDTQDAFTCTGHAIECRLYAENPAKNFMPSPGTLETFDWDGLEDGVRIDSGFRSGDEVTFFYDPMIAKVICHADTRDAAIDKSIRTLNTIRLSGITSNLAFLKTALDHPVFRAGDVFTGFIDTYKADLLPS